jgi:hypothetical protein
MGEGKVPGDRRRNLAGWLTGWVKGGVVENHQGVVEEKRGRWDGMG